ASGAPRQVIHPPEGVALRIVDVADGGEERDAAAGAETAPFDLARGPLFRATLVRRSAEESLLVLVMHHIVTDGWSNGVIARELGAFYDAFRSGRDPALAELSVQYADFAAWQRDWLAGGVLAGQLDHWRKELSGAPASLDLPTDRPRPAIKGYRGSR